LRLLKNSETKHEREGHEFHRLRKNSALALVLKGRGFEPRRKECGMYHGFSR